ncbi:MAG: hypothetical protein IPM38_03145 [Ignavibacteria bacterium]|nr:hypothetical protein [Ignavibacteria bacterium]
MENTSKYLLLRLEERNGEYEYIHRSVHALADGEAATVNRLVNNYTKNFYGGKADPEDNGFYFQGGEVFVRVSSWEFVSEEEFGVLKKYL